MRSLKFILPHRDTLHKYLLIKDIIPSIYHNILDQLKLLFKDSDVKTHQAVLIHDEIRIRRELEYNVKHDYVEGFVDNGKERTNSVATDLCMFLMRGLFPNWSYIVCHTFFVGPFKGNF